MRADDCGWAALCFSTAVWQPDHVLGRVVGGDATSAPSSAPSWPVSTASRISPAPAETSAVRTAPTLTHVPVASLKSSATRPSNTIPLRGVSGSRKRPASPMR